MDKQVKKFWDRHDWLVERRAESFLANMLGAVTKRAQGGDVAAIRFLEEKGLLVFPCAEDRK